MQKQSSYIGTKNRLKRLINFTESSANTEFSFQAESDIMKCYISLPTRCLPKA